ncbi:MAG: XdhC family protein [Candidatus Binatia bacterium]
MRGLAEELIQVEQEGAAAVLVTVVENGGNSQIAPGDKCLVHEGKIRLGTIHHKPFLEAILREADIRLGEVKSKLVQLEIPGTAEKAEVFFEVMASALRLVVVGAGHIAVPVVKFAKLLDFYVTVLDDRLLFANRDRFPDADEILVGDMAEILKSRRITSSTYIVLITRGHKYDEPCLREIIYSPAKYIGMIGSRRRTKACFQRFSEEGRIAEEVIQKVYAPIGLEINSETPEEIALAILAEIVKVRRGGKAESLSGH